MDERPPGKEIASETFSTTVSRHLEHLLQLSKKSVSPIQFYGELLQGAADITDAFQGWVWRVSQGSHSLVVRHAKNSSDDSTEETNLRRQETLNLFLNRDDPIYDDLHPGDDRIEPGVAVQSPASTIHYLLVRDSSTAIVLELIIPKTVVTTSVSTTQGVLRALSEISTDFHRNNELLVLRTNDRQHRQLLEFATEVQHSLEPTAVAVEVANSAQRILGVERASIVRRGLGRRYQLEAVSGASGPNRRSVESRRIVQRATDAMAAGLPYSSQPESSDQDGLGWFEVHRLANGDQVESSEYALLLESTTARPESPELLERFVQIASMGLENATRYSVSKRFGFFGLMVNRHRHARWIIGSALLAGIVLSLFLIRAELKIKSTGHVRPDVERGAFSPEDGEIVELFAQHDDSVAAGDPLLRIQSAELEMQQAKMRGELKATNEKLLAIESRRITGNDANHPDRPTSLLSASAEELEILKKSLLQQLKILDEREQKLMVRSPVQGRITTWQIEKLLEGRPVNRGQLLMSVADVEGNWIAEIEIRDHRMAHVLNATKNESDWPEVSFVFIASPETVCYGRLKSIDQSLSHDSVGLPVVKAKVEIDATELPNLRPGAKITANIHCGKRPLAYVWFHELVASIRSKFF